MGQLVGRHACRHHGNDRHDRAHVPATRKISPDGSTAAAGPASAMETGIRASDTKKSRLETRPSRCGGTRRCSRVPQMTMPTLPVAPKMNRAAATAQKLSMMPTAAIGRLPGSPGHHHHREVAAGKRKRGGGQRGRGAADAHDGEQETEHAGVAAQLVADHEREQDFDGADQEQHGNAGPEQGPQQPGRADGVADALAEVVAEGRLGRASARMPASASPLAAAARLARAGGGGGSG